MLAPLVVTACASTPSIPLYDSAAKEAPVRVTEKRVAEYVSREMAQVRSGTVWVPVGNAFVVITLSNSSTKIPIYEYGVVDQHKNTTNVFSEYPAFDLGQCLKLFTSQQPSYPRLAYGASCEEF